MPLYPGFPLAGSDYTTGTITLTAGSKDFTLTGSNPLGYAAAQAGDEIYIAHTAKVLLIETITNTGGTLIYPCPNDCAGVDLPFRLQLKNASSRLQGMAANLLQAIGSGNLAALDEVQLAENQLIAGDAIQGTFKTVNIADLNIEGLPASLTAIAALTLNENELIAGGEEAGTVKATSINELLTGVLASLNALTLGEDHLIAGDGAGQLKTINLSELQNTLPTLLTAIGNLDLGENKIIAGGATAGSVKAIDLPIGGGDGSVDISDKLDKTGGTITGDLSVEGNLTAPNIYTKTQSDNKYLDKTGGTVTGALTVNGQLVSSIGIKAGTGSEIAEYWSNGNVYGSIWKEWDESGFAKQAIDARINQQITAALEAFKNNPEFTGTLTVNGDIQATGNIEANYLDETSEGEQA